MTSGELERLSLSVESAFRNLEVRIMDDMVRRIKINGFSTASADWQISRLQQLGMSEEEIKEWTRIALEISEEETEKLFSDEIYRQYMGYEKAYQISGMKQIPFEENLQLQSLIKAIKYQTIDTFRNMTNSMGFVKQDKAGHIYGIPLTEFYQDTLDTAILDIHSGAFSYQAVLKRTIEDMTKSGIRWIDYKSGRHNRIDVAARRAVMTGFRQVQGKINEQVARDLGTDSFEVTYHIGARPSHQVWQGKVWTRQQLVDVCGLGSVTGLHGANCYHDYNAFIPGISVRTYSDEQLEQMMAKENTPKNYLGKEYTAYEALQKQRQMETAMRKTRRDIRLLQEGEADKNAVTVKRCRYQVQMQQYKAFSKAMGLPEQMQRVYQDGLGRVASGPIPNKIIVNTRIADIIKLPNRDKLKIPEEKFTKYALNPEKAPNKARAFKEALGYDMSNYQELIKEIELNVSKFPAKEKPDNGHGKRYEVIMELRGLNGKNANVLTGWIDDKEKGEMRMTTAHVDKRRKSD